MSVSSAVLGWACRCRAVTSWGICLWPLMRRKDRSALSIPAAVQRSGAVAVRDLRTVERHLSNAYSELEIRSRHELAQRWALALAWRKDFG